jgi:hypothetical protein
MTRMIVYKAVDITNNSGDLPVRLTSTWAYGESWEVVYTPGILAIGPGNTPLFAYSTLEQAIQSQDQSIKNRAVQIWEAEALSCVASPEYVYAGMDFWFGFWDTYQAQGGRIKADDMELPTDLDRQFEIMGVPEGTVLCPQGLTLIRQLLPST